MVIDAIDDPVNTSSTQQAILNRFRQVWGYDSFRPPQGEIVQSLVNKQDTLVVMPTGGGKSICFQLPALMHSGITLVISPLVALIEDQVQDLQQRGLAAALLHSEVPTIVRKKTLQAIRNNRLHLVYLSPETLLSPSVWATLCEPQVCINGIVLDEAHCLVQWGDTFRPAYRRLGAVRPALVQTKPAGTKIPVATFTATANPFAQQTLQDVFDLQNPTLVRLSPYRSNLHLSVKTVWTPRGREQALLAFIQAHPGQSGLVYVRTRRTTEELTTWLKAQGFSVMAYHAGLPAVTRRQIEATWLTGKCQFVICTNAFGMGINHPHVRWVAHFHAPSTLSEYIQEIGRGGRDGASANALTLVSEPTGWLDPQDKQRWQFFSDQSTQLQLEAQRLVKRLPTEGAVEAVTRQYAKGAIALSLLHSTGQLTWLDPFHYRLHLEAKPSKSPFFNATQEMKAFLFGKRCRWQMLLQQFGFAAEAQGMRCGHCDNCHGYTAVGKIN
jgi:ATP-dependent DNA helicase RecQ